jgi:lipopolysaccharide export system ATP-binding protein
LIGLLGPNGSGKTICFYAISGIVAADHGQILLGTTDVTAMTTPVRARASASAISRRRHRFFAA